MVHVADVSTPTPGPRDVLIRVHAAAVTSVDGRIRAANFPHGFAMLGRLAFGVRRPRRKVLGGAFSGVVESVGTKVEGFAVGDAVGGMNSVKMGAHAEYVAAPVAKTTPLPAGVSHEDAAAILFGGSTALHFLRTRASLQAGQSVLVNGASGAVGTAAVQLVKHLGAIVTGVTSTPNIVLVTELGADHVIDYTVTPLSGITEKYDVVFDTVGNVDIPTGRRLLTDNGVLLLAVADLRQTIGARGNVKAGPASEKAQVFAEVLGLLASGDLKAVIDQAAPLDDIVALHTRVDSGRKVGNLVVTP
ncbi:MAG: NAD(P)-dependent alcohol dehydrogenase [Nocardioides sp.]|nr:NAD(P)-dependent alcohol dehydrogenase [Nocardioides sp.]